MPRLSPALLRQAKAEHKFLPKLLRTCRDIGTARNELRWLREHAETSTESETRRDAIDAQSLASSANSERTVALRLEQLVNDRARGVPLQYVIGTEFFGDLEIACRPRVLIPRPDTATAISFLISRIATSQAFQTSTTIRALDLCTGSGCIPLLFQHELLQHIKREVRLHVTGVDISPIALELARHNRQRQLAQYEEATRFDELVQLGAFSSAMSAIEGLQNTTFVAADALDPTTLASRLKENDIASCDILMSNPPYISVSEFAHRTTRSVRKFEPKLALVPPLRENVATNKADRANIDDDDSGDLFYPKLIAVAEHLQAKVIWFEVSNLAQATRVGKMIRSQTTAKSNIIELWREDLPHQQWSGEPADEWHDGFRVRGRGNGRSVAWWRGSDGVQWCP